MTLLDASAYAFSRRLSAPPLGAMSEPRLRQWESARVEAGPWFSSLSSALRQNILARCRVRHVARGTVLARRGQPASDWIGVAGGALRLGSICPDGRIFTLDMLSPGEWYGDIALLDGATADLDIEAHAPSTLLLCPKAELQALIAQSNELQQAFVQLNCRRLRHMFRRMEDLQTLPLWQRVAVQLQRLARQFGRPLDDGLCIDLHLTQGDLADLLCASRQRINGVLRHMQGEGILVHTAARLTVRSPERLAAVAEGRLELKLPRHAHA